MNLLLELIELKELFNKSEHESVQKLLLVEFERLKQELLTQCDDVHVRYIQKLYIS